jgi:predicted RNA binding protein YcfA (HicA-like mRNA interferase family)
VSTWRSSKAKQVLAALLRIGWTLKRQVGSHQLLERPGWPDYVFAFHDREEIGPKMLAKVRRKQDSVPRISNLGLDRATMLKAR